MKTAKTCPYFDERFYWCKSPANPTYFIPELIYCFTDYKKCRFYKEAGTRK